MAKANGKKPKPDKTPQGITHITVGGYKSIAREQTIEIRPLTILAGANSSGKSSIMQPLLLLKQTLEAPYDPGALLLNGPNLRFTSFDQLLTRNAISGTFGAFGHFLVGVTDSDGDTVRLVIGRNTKGEINIAYMNYLDEGRTRELRPMMDRGALNDLVLDELVGPKYDFAVNRNRCFLSVDATAVNGGFSLAPAATFVPKIQGVIHVPGLRGHPERAYGLSSIGPFFSGKFDDYTATLVARWTRSRDQIQIGLVSESLKGLGLGWKIQAQQINDAEIEIQIARIPRPHRGGAHDLVNIADVGFGVSQTLPVVVALLAAEPGQLVYLEQPEIHLHPRAQVAMAQILANAAMRGVKVVAETHSSLLLLGVQALVAEGKLPPEKVVFHWFKRDDEGATEIQTAELDEAGRYGDWPDDPDFDLDNVMLDAERRYLDAAELRRAAR